MRRRSAVLLVSAAGAAAAILLPSIQMKQSVGDTKITGVRLSEPTPIVLGPSQQIRIGFTVTAQDDSGIRSMSPVGLWGPNYAVVKTSQVTCKALSATTSSCSGYGVLDTTQRKLWLDNAGWWSLQVQVNANDGDHFATQRAKTFGVLRRTQTVIAGVPAQARAGERVTITGQLIQADWGQHTYTGASGQRLQLRFKPQGSNSYQPVASVVNAADGSVRATVTVKGTGSYAWFFTGTHLAAPSHSTDSQVTVGA